MSSIDDRIVRLEVQDSEFAKRLEQDESLLKKFNSTLNSVGDTKISDNLQKIADRFSNLGIVGVRALQNITDKAISTGSQLVKSLSVDNISSGWQKLQSQTKAVGTLSIQGYDMEEVNDVIKQLMWYSDETSYNFEDMLTSMTKFTAQGYELKEAMETLEGIANWSAVAGQNAAAGSSAMTALSKAVGRGYLYQQDWSSLQTLMMDNKQVRQMILDTAVELGTLEKTGEGTYRSLSKSIMSSIGASEFNIDQFATYLTTGKWFTSDVLVATMKKYAAAVKPVYDYVQEHNVSASEAIEALNGQISEQALNFLAAAQEARSLSDALESVRVGSASTWQKTFNIIFGDYERQKEIWTDLSGYLYELFVESGNARNALLEQWAAKGGADAIIQGFYNIMEALIALRDTFRTAWQSIFPPTTVESLLNVSNKFKNFTENLILSEEASTKLGRALQGVFSVFRLSKDILQALLRPIGELLGTSGNLGDTILTIAQTVGDAVTNFVHWVEVSGILDKAVNVVIGTVKVLWSVVKVAGAAILYAIAGIIVGVSKLISLLRNFGSSFVDAFKNAADGVKSFLGRFKKVKEDTNDVVEVQRAYSGAIQQTTEESEKATKNISGMASALKIFGAGLSIIFTGELISKLLKILGIFVALRSALSIGSLISSIVKSFASVFKIVSIGVNALSALVNNLQAKAWLTYAFAIGITAASLYALSKIPAEDIGRTLETLGRVILMIISSIGKMSIIPTIALAILSKVDLWPIILAFGSLIGVIFGLGVASNIIAEFGGKVKSIFSDENVRTLVKNIQRLSGIFTILSEGLKNLMLGSMFLKIGNAFVTFAENIKDMFKLFSPSFEVNIFGGNKNSLLRFALSIAVVTASLIVLTNALKAFSEDILPIFENTDPKAITNLTTSLIALGVSAGAIIIFGGALVKLSKDLTEFGKNMLGVAIALAAILGIVASLWALTDALTALQDIKWPTLAKAGVILLGLVAAVKQVITMGLGLGLIATAAPEIAGIVIAAIIAIIAVGAALIIGIKELVNIVDFLGESVAKNAPGIAQGIKDIADAILYCVYAIGSIPRTLGAGFIGLGTGDNANYKNAINNITALVAAAEQGGKDVVEVEKSYAANSQQIVKEGYDNVQETVTEGGEDIESSVDETGKNVEKKTLSWWDKLKSGAALATAQIPIIGDWASKKILSTIDTTSEESSQRAEQGGQQTMKSLAEGLLNGTVSVSDLVGQIPDLLNGWLFPEGTNWAAYNYGKDSATDLLNGFMDNAGTITYEKKLLSPSRKSQFGMVSQENPDPVNVVWVPKWTPPENKSILDQLNDMFDTDKLTSAVGDFGSLTDVLGDTVKESTKELQDWELSLEELVKKYSTLTTSWVNGQRVVNWAYNGPMGGVIDEYHEWVYEGPMGGEYDDITDQYVTDINGNVVALANWTAEWQELYMGHAEYMDDQIASINENTSALTTSISDQNSLISGYNEDILSSLSGLDTKLSGLNTGISSLGSSLSNMGVYLDGDVLAGGLTDKIEKNINLNNIYRQMGVIR